jgi:hypothetical protein
MLTRMNTPASSCFAVLSPDQRYFALLHGERKVLRAGGAKPEMLDRFALEGESKKPATIQTHQHFRAVWIGTLRDHGTG